MMRLHRWLGITLMATSPLVYCSESAMLVGIDSFTPKNPPAVALRGEGIEVHELYKGEDDVGLSVRSSKHGTKEIWLPDSFVQLDAVSLAPGGRLVALGHATGLVQSVAIADIASGRVLDDFYSYRPSVSPDRSWVAFEEFFPPHNGEYPKRAFKIYDIRLSAAANRPAGISADDRQYVGATLNIPGGIGVSKSKPTWRITSKGFHWSADSRSFVFVIGEEGNRLVAVSARLSESNDRTWRLRFFSLNEDGKGCRDRCDVARTEVLGIAENSVKLMLYGEQYTSTGREVTVDFGP